MNATPNVAVSDPQGAPPLSRGLRLVVAGLLALFVALALWQATTTSETFDEPMYILSGFSYVVTGDLSLNREHPPLAKYLIGLALLGLDLQLPPDYQIRPGIPLAFYASQPHASAPQILLRARLPFVLLGVVLLLYVFQWARTAFGVHAGVAALALAATNPNLLAHSVIAANDFAVTVFGFAACFHAWRWLATDSRRSLLCAALMLGLALGCKLTALVLLPVLGVAVLAACVQRRSVAPLGGAALAGAAAVGVLWLLYGGEARSLASAREHPRFSMPGPENRVFATEALERGLPALFGEHRPIPLLSMLKGIDMQLEHAEGGHVNYWRGQNSAEGNRLFYVGSWLIKNPEGLSLLLLLSALGWRRVRRGGQHEWLLFGLPLVVFAIFSMADLQLGLKYVLPAVPFLCVAAAALLAPPRPTLRELRVGALVLLGAALAAGWAFHDGRPFTPRQLFPWVLPAIVAVTAWRVRANGNGRAAWTAPAAILLTWAVLASGARQPHNLMYFNEWVGGPENGWRWSVIGDDWGQDTAALGHWMAEQKLDTIRYDYYGEADPEVWGVRYRPSFGHPRLFEPFTGLFAVHVGLLARFPENYFWVPERPPLARLGHTILIWDLTEQDRVNALVAMAARPLPAPAPEPQPELR